MKFGSLGFKKVTREVFLTPRALCVTVALDMKVVDLSFV
jgi:hypothetical protein